MPLLSPWWWWRRCVCVAGVVACFRNGLTLVLLWKGEIMGRSFMLPLALKDFRTPRPKNLLVLNGMEDSGACVGSNKMWIYTRKHVALLDVLRVACSLPVVACSDQLDAFTYGCGHKMCAHWKHFAQITIHQFQARHSIHQSYEKLQTPRHMDRAR